MFSVTVFPQDIFFSDYVMVDQSTKILLNQRGSKFSAVKEIAGHLADLVFSLFTNVSKHLTVATQF